MSKRTYFKMFTFHLVNLIKSPIIIIFTSIYSFIFILLGVLKATSFSYFYAQNVLEINLIQYILISLFFGINVILFTKFLYSKHKLLGLFKMEQRTGIKYITSFSIRMLIILAITTIPTILLSVFTILISLPFNIPSFWFTNSIVWPNLYFIFAILIYIGINMIVLFLFNSELSLLINSFLVLIFSLSPLITTIVEGYSRGVEMENYRYKMTQQFYIKNGKNTYEILENDTNYSALLKDKDFFEIINNNLKSNNSAKEINFNTLKRNQLYIESSSYETKDDFTNNESLIFALSSGNPFFSLDENKKSIIEGTELFKVMNNIHNTIKDNNISITNNGIMNGDNRYDIKGDQNYVVRYDNLNNLLDSIYNNNKSLRYIIDAIKGYLDVLNIEINTMKFRLYNSPYGSNAGLHQIRTFNSNSNIDRNLLIVLDQDRWFYEPLNAYEREINYIIWSMYQNLYLQSLPTLMSQNKINIAHNGVVLNMLNIFNFPTFIFNGPNFIENEFLWSNAISYMSYNSSIKLKMSREFNSVIENGINDTSITLFDKPVTYNKTVSFIGYILTYTLIGMVLIIVSFYVGKNKNRE